MQRLFQDAKIDAILWKSASHLAGDWDKKVMAWKALIRYVTDGMLLRVESNFRDRAWFNQHQKEISRTPFKEWSTLLTDKPDIFPYNSEQRALRLSQVN